MAWRAGASAMPASRRSRAPASRSSRSAPPRSAQATRAPRPAAGGRPAGRRSSGRPKRSGRRTRAPHASGRATASAARAPAQVRATLARLARALDAGDVAGAAACFAFPSLLLTGGDTHEFRSARPLLHVLGRALRRRESAGIVRSRPEVEEVRALGEGLFDCAVRWVGEDDAGRPAAEERSHYVLQETMAGTALVRVAVAVEPLPEARLPEGPPAAELQSAEGSAGADASPDGSAGNEAQPGAEAEPDAKADAEAEAGAPEQDEAGRPAIGRPTP